jgi:hypothetical protein
MIERHVDNRRVYDLDERREHYSQCNDPFIHNANSFPIGFRLAWIFVESLMKILYRSDWGENTASTKLVLDLTGLRIKNFRSFSVVLPCEVCASLLSDTVFDYRQKNPLEFSILRGYSPLYE